MQHDGNSFEFVYRTQRRGMHDLKVWPGVEADGQRPTSTPGKSTTGEDQMSRLAKVIIERWFEEINQKCLFWHIAICLPLANHYNYNILFNLIH